MGALIQHVNYSKANSPQGRQSDPGDLSRRASQAPRSRATASNRPHARSGWISPETGQIQELMRVRALSNAPMSLPKLSDLEKHTVKSIAISTDLPEAKVKEIFVALLHDLCQNISAKRNQISIPYFGDFKISYEQISLEGGQDFDLAEQVFVRLNPVVTSVIHDTLAGKETVTKKALKDAISMDLKGKMFGAAS